MITTRCPDTGFWRAWLDEAGQPEANQHLQACAACQTQVESLRRNASHAAAALDGLPAQAAPTVREVAAARARLDDDTSGWQAEPRGWFSWPGRLSAGWRIAASGIAAAVVLSVGLSVSPDGRALASQFLAQFRSQQVTPIAITPQSQAEIQRTISQLSNYGLVKAPSYVRTGRSESQNTVGSVAEASQRVGFALKTPDAASLPQGLSPTPRIQVIPADEVRFTFDAAKARAYFQATGHPEVSLPERFDGTALVVAMPPAALFQYGQGGSRAALVIGQAGELQVGVDSPRNVSLEELRDFLLGLPGIPADTAAQLRSITDWRTTLPIPVPTDKVNWKSASFGGHQGLLLDDNSGAASAAVWQADGHLYGLAGPLKATDLQRVAASLH
jgi:anti-sigma factor RsiW